MEAFVHLASQTQGRERLFRATQYSCMLLSYMLEHKAGQEKVVTKLKDLESSMSSGRKLFRLGNMVHAIVAAKKAAQLPDVVPCICLTVANLNRALYFICDTILWVRSVGLVDHIDKKKWRQRATRCYYYSLVVSLAKDLYELSWRMEKMAQAGKSKQGVPPCGQQLQRVASLAPRGLLSFLLLLCPTLWNYPPLSLDLLKNICDLSSPLDRLGIYKTNPGVIGLCGLISSVVGIFTVAMPGLRLNP